MIAKPITGKAALKLAIFTLKNYRQRNHAIGYHAHVLGQDFIFAARDHEAYEKLTRAISFIESLLPLLHRLEPEKKIQIKGLSSAQNEWLNKYQGCTGFEPMNLEDLISGAMSFNDCARNNIAWYEQHKADAFAQITDRIPYSERKKRR